MSCRTLPSGCQAQLGKSFPDFPSSGSIEMKMAAAIPATVLVTEETFVTPVSGLASSEVLHMSMEMAS